MKLYYESGYLNMRGILDEGYPFNIIVGGRGIGKSYDALRTSKEDFDNRGDRFLLLRRTQNEADLISKPQFSPFKPINDDMGCNVQVESISMYNSQFYEAVGDEKNIIGYTGALSTIAKMRGFDASDVKRIIYDEFIPEKHVPLLKNEAEALFNAYETINRNRELKGLPPVQLVLLANSNDITNPVFQYLNLVRRADKMRKGNTDRWVSEARGIQLIFVNHSPISKKKASTALYKLTEGSTFASMALDNSFNVDRSHVRPRPLNEYIPVCSIGELCIYRHKTETRLYATTHISGVFNRKFSIQDTDRLHYQRVYRSHWDMYVSNKIDFEDILSETLFVKYWESVKL